MIDAMKQNGDADTDPTPPGTRTVHSGWTFFTNHGHILLCLAANADLTVREIAQLVGITERAAIRIIGELEAAGVLSRTREGRRNRYTIDYDAPLRHPLERHRSVGDLVRAIGALLE